MNLRPMLAAHKLPRHLPLPMEASYKVDGIRMIIGEKGECIAARSGLLIPSADVQRIFKGLPAGLDGELVFGDPTDPECFNNTQSAITGKKLSAEACAMFTFFVFDIVMDARFTARSAAVGRIARKCGNKQVVALHQTLIETKAELDTFVKDAVTTGFEGVILRKETAPYKHGRSTEAEAYMLKIKQYEDSEAEVLEVLPEKDNATMMGTIVGRDIHTGQTVNIGPGSTTHVVREQWMANADLCKGLIVVYQHIKYGAKERRRSATLKGVRASIDIS